MEANQLKPEPRLDSPAGLQALERNLGKDAVAQYGRAGYLDAFLESWSHPWLARWAQAAGYVNPHNADLRLEDRTGHFDHAPYALASVSGPAVVTPYEASRGPVYLVVYKDWVKAVTIMGDVEHQVGKLYNAKNTWRPSWPVAFTRAGQAIRHGLAAREDAQMSEESRAKAIQEATEAFDALHGDLGKALLEWRCWTCDERLLLTRQLARVQTLRAVLTGQSKIAA